MLPVHLYLDTWAWARPGRAPSTWTSSELFEGRAKSQKSTSHSGQSKRFVPGSLVGIKDIDFVGWVQGYKRGGTCRANIVNTVLLLLLFRIKRGLKNKTRYCKLRQSHHHPNSNLSFLHFRQPQKKLQTRNG